MALFCFHSILFCLMDSAWRMLWRGVDRIHLDRNVTGIGEVMIIAGRNQDCIIFFDMPGELRSIRSTAHLDNALALLDPQKLVGIRVDFLADVSTRRNAH